jgi:hypothetical protein
VVCVDVAPPLLSYQLRRQAEIHFLLFELRSLSSVIAKSRQTCILISPIARSVSVTGSGSIAHVGVSNPGYVVYIIYGRGW